MKRASRRNAGAYAPVRQDVLGRTHRMHTRRGLPRRTRMGLAGGHRPQPGSFEREEGYGKATLHQRAHAQPNGHVQFFKQDVVVKDPRRELRDEVAGQPPGFVVAAW